MLLRKGSHYYCSDGYENDMRIVGRGLWATTADVGIDDTAVAVIVFVEECHHY
jgi:hypothetical protein